MNKPKHTSGTWSVSPANNHEVWAEDGAYLIAELPPLGHDCEPPDDEYDPSANAHLIAAAPSLLEALKDQRQLMVGYKSRLECDGAYVAVRQVADRIEVVTALIAKAEGRNA